MYLREIPHIRLNADIELSKKVTENDLNNYLRMFKSPDESLSQDLIYSPFFDNNTVYYLDEDYAVRMGFYNILCEKLPESCISVYLSYDFSNTPVSLTYSTGGEYGYVAEMIQECLSKTNLSLLLFVSHLNQFANKAGTKLKAEHYHILLGTDEDADVYAETGKFIGKLREKPIIGRITMKGI